MSFSLRPLGRTELTVFPIGIGGGYSLSGKHLEYARDRGVNYFFWGPIFPTYYPMTRWLASLKPGQREKIVLATVSYIWKIPGSIKRSVERHLRWLGTDYLDLFHLGWIRSKDEKALEILLKFKDEGLIRHLAITTHNRKLAARLAHEWPLDAVMIRYNAAHRGAEEEVFPQLPEKGPALVSFNSTRWRSLLRRPRRWPKDEPIPSAEDCYRFVLSHPKVTLCLAGPRNRNELDSALRAVELGPLEQERYDWLCRFGAAVRGSK
jgi:aryl-alcohol dehydrogenase-like predicted oxidoreductase